MNVERFLGVAAVFLAIPVGIASWGFGVGSPKSPGAGFWPLVIAVVMFGLGLMLILRPKPSSMTASGDSRWGKFIIALGTLVFYVVFLESLGYLLATTAMLLVQFRWVENRSWKASAWIAASAAVISLFVFKVLLKVSLPTGVLALPAGW